MSYPLRALQKSQGKNISVRLKTNIEYTGRLKLSDPFMNLTLENCSEIENGKVRRRYGQAFLRGNNILFIKID